MSRAHAQKLDQQPPRFRSACDACHQRKIRCKLSAGAISCEPCSSTNRACFFTPCRKVGRPRGPQTQSQMRESTLNSPSTPSSSSSNNFSREWQVSNDLNQSILALNHYHDDETHLDLSGGFDLGLLDVTAPHEELSSASNSSISSQKVGTPMLAVDFDTYSTTPQNVGSTQPRDVKHTTDNPESGTTCFLSMLHTCSELEEIMNELKGSESDNGCTDWSIPVLLRSKAERLDIAGHDLMLAISNLTSQAHGVTVPDTALLALAIVATLKLLEVCHFWTERSSYSVGHINHALLLKRLDGNLMQARTILGCIRTMDASVTSLAQSGLSTTLQIHNQIQDALQTQFSWDMQV